MLQRLFLLLLFAGSPALRAATFDVTSSVDRNEVELGETLRYTLSLTVNGRLDFPVQIDQPKFEGFQVQGPGRSDSSSWVNGAVTEQHVFAWDLVPIKVGSVNIPPIKANAKDAATGEVVKLTPGFTIKVKRPKNAYNGLSAQAPSALPTYGIQNQAQEEPTPAMDDSGLHDIKGDRGPPWAALALVFSGFAAVMAFLIWWAHRPSLEANSLPTVRDPRANAFKQLDAAWHRYLDKDEKGFSVLMGQALRDYLRQRLDLRREVTLAEAFRVGVRRLPDAEEQAEMRDLLMRLELLLYADTKLTKDDPEFMDRTSRRLIHTFERLAGR